MIPRFKSKAQLYLFKPFLLNMFCSTAITQSSSQPSVGWLLW